MFEKQAKSLKNKFWLENLKVNKVMNDLNQMNKRNCDFNLIISLCKYFVL